MEKVEKQPPFGKRGKTTEDNAFCMIHGTDCCSPELFIVIHSYLVYTTDPSRKDLAGRAKELDKYLKRGKGILTATDPYFKYPLTPVYIVQ